jgi:hypothetical protein
MTAPAFSYPLRVIPYRHPIGLGPDSYRRNFWDKTNMTDFSDGGMTQEYRLMDKAWSSIDLPTLTAEQAGKYLHLLKSIEADPALGDSTWEGLGDFMSEATGAAQFGDDPSYDSHTSGGEYYFDNALPDLANRTRNAFAKVDPDSDMQYRPYYPNDAAPRSRTFFNGFGTNFEGAVVLSNFTALSLGLIENGAGEYKPILGYLLWPSFSVFGPFLGQYDYNLSTVAYAYRAEIEAAAAVHIAEQQALAEASEWWDIFIHYPAVQVTSLSIAGITLPLARLYTRQQYYAREDENEPYEIQWDLPLNHTSGDPPPIPALSNPTYYDAVQ